jgi:hypothetical protein
MMLRGTLMPPCPDNPFNSPPDELKLGLPGTIVNNFELKKYLSSCRLSHKFDLAALEWVGGLTSPHQ